ncbi:hypothetical protein IU487_31545 [Nocardia puris]|uniref:hypothetical protein n=1 Tax=Nocardia puris TaxID=208602 RepID=UPI0018935D88|nr:hypothetical protein [Nocardia puris]MBF6215532.1 hypothetical protein [Nocardia puris]
MNRLHMKILAAIHAEASAGSLVGGMEMAALSGGVPQNWIAHARLLGEQGDRWDPESLPTASGPNNRQRLLDALLGDIRDLRRYMVTEAAHRVLHPPEDLAAAARMERAVTVMHARAVVITALLHSDAPDEQAVMSGIWGHSAHRWVTVGFARAVKKSASEIHDLWTRLAARDIGRVGRQHFGLNKAGLPADYFLELIPMKRSPHDIIESIAERLAQTSTTDYRDAWKSATTQTTEHSASMSTVAGEPPPADYVPYAGTDARGTDTDTGVEWSGQVIFSDLDSGYSL